MRILSLLFSCILSSSTFAAPFQIFDASQLREDFTVSWAEAGTTHGTVISEGTTFTASDAGPNIAVYTTSSADTTMSILTAGLFTSGTLLANSGPGVTVIYLNRRSGVWTHD